MSTKFKKTKENFTCENCGAFVVGNGYTNHCPKCLWGKHVDVNPGDREGECQGMMEPIGFSKKGDIYSVIHKCVKCGQEKVNRVSQDDDFNKLAEIAKKSAERII